MVLYLNILLKKFNLETSHVVNWRHLIVKSPWSETPIGVDELSCLLGNGKKETTFSWLLLWDDMRYSKVMDQGYHRKWEEWIKLRKLNGIYIYECIQDDTTKIQSRMIEWNLTMEIPKIISKDKNIGNHIYIGSSILQIYRRIFWHKISIDLKLIKTYENIKQNFYK